MGKRTFRKGGQDFDILAGRTATAGSALVVARDAGGVIEDRSQSVATVCTGIACHPFPQEQLFAIDLRGR